MFEKIFETPGVLEVVCWSLNSMTWCSPPLNCSIIYINKHTNKQVENKQLLLDCKRELKQNCRIQPDRRPFTILDRKLQYYTAFKINIMIGVNGKGSSN